MTKKKKKLRQIDAPFYRYWNALYMAFYSKQIYRDVAKRWRGLGALYFLFVIALLSIPYSFFLIYDFDQSLTKDVLEPLKYLPDLYVQNGEVQFDKPMPYFVMNDKKQVIIIIDTKDHITGFSDKYPHLAMIVNKNQLKLNTPNALSMDSSKPNNLNSAMAHRFDKGDNLVINGKQILAENPFRYAMIAGKLMIYPIFVSTLFSMLMVLFLVLGLLSQLIARIFFSFKLSFMQSTRLLIVSGTPMILLMFFLLSINYLLSGLGIVLLSILAAYFCFAVYSLKSEQRGINTL